jgi:ubiquinone biosynthesis protein COQ4
MTTDIRSLPAHVRWTRAIRALARVLAHPEETDQVLVFSTYANAGTVYHRLDRFYDDARGQALFDQHRAIDSHTIDLAAMSRLPEGTLGHAYARFMTSHGLTPDVFDGPPADIDDPRAAYVIQRMRQTHDLWHVVTNAETDPAGEVALQAFTFAQVGAPSSAILAALGTVKVGRHDATIVKDVVDMLRLGRRAEPLNLFPWEDHWATPLAEVRRLLGLPAVPRAIGGYTKDFAAA